MGSVIAESTRLARKTSNMFARLLVTSACALATIVVLVSYVDLGLQSPRLMILFGGSIGLLPVVERLWWVKDVQGPEPGAPAPEQVNAGVF